MQRPFSSGAPWGPCSVISLLSTGFCIHSCPEGTLLLCSQPLWTQTKGPREGRSVEVCSRMGPLRPFLGRGSGSVEHLSLQAAPHWCHLDSTEPGWALLTLRLPPGPCCHPTSDHGLLQLACPHVHTHTSFFPVSSQEMVAGLQEGTHREAVGWLGAPSWQVEEPCFTSGAFVSNPRTQGLFSLDCSVFSSASHRSKHLKYKPAMAP